MMWSMKYFMIPLFHACMHACLWKHCSLETTHYFFFKIWHNDTWLDFFKKILKGTEFRGTFCFAQIWAQWVKNSGIFWKKKKKIFSFFFKSSKMKHCHLYSTANPLSVQNQVLKLCVKMLLANQIVGFFKVQHLKKKVRDQVDFLYIN